MFAVIGIWCTYPSYIHNRSLRSLPAFVIFSFKWPFVASALNKIEKNDLVQWIKNWIIDWIARIIWIEWKEFLLFLLQLVISRLIIERIQYIKIKKTFGEKVNKKAFCYQKLFWPITIWIDCFSDLKSFADSWPSASNFKSFSRSLYRTIFSHSRSEQFW